MRTRVILFLAALALRADAQPAPATPQSAAPVELTGYWVSLITEDWRTRMLTAPKGDYYSIPLNAAGRKVADRWDAAKDIAAGKQCMSYGAAALMRVPERLHITWQDGQTLKLETDAGRQTRIFSFSRAPRADARPSMQGTSLAEWQTPQSTRQQTSKISSRDANTPGFPGIFNGEDEKPPDTRKLGGTLKVVTTNLLPGYLRNNGVPYSASTVLTEYYDLHQRKGVDYLVITQSVDDPQYLDVPWVTSNHFRREPDGSKWDPRPCELLLPSK